MKLPPLAGSARGPIERFTPVSQKCRHEFVFFRRRHNQPRQRQRHSKNDVAPLGSGHDSAARGRMRIINDDARFDETAEIRISLMRQLHRRIVIGHQAGRRNPFPRCLVSPYDCSAWLTDRKPSISKLVPVSHERATLAPPSVASGPRLVPFHETAGLPALTDVALSRERAVRSPDSRGPCVPFLLQVMPMENAVQIRAIQSHLFPQNP